MKTFALIAAVLLATSAQAQTAPRVSSAQDLIGTRYVGSSDPVINGLLDNGGFMVGAAEDGIGVHVYQHPRNYDFTLLVMREVGRRGEHAVWEVTDVATLAASNDSQYVGSSCQWGTRGGYARQIIGVISDNSPSVSNRNGNDIVRASDSVEIIDGYTRSPQPSGTGTGGGHIIYCELEGSGDW